MVHFCHKQTVASIGVLIWIYHHDVCICFKLIVFLLFL